MLRAASLLVLLATAATAGAAPGDPVDVVVRYPYLHATHHVNADGTISGCGIVRMAGDCAAVCPQFDAAGGHYRACFDGPDASGPATDQVITIALP